MMEIIIAILIIILIFGLIFINSVRDYRIKKLEEDVEEIYRQKKPLDPFKSSDNSASRNFTTYKTPKEPLGPLLSEKKTNKITSIILETDSNRMLKKYTTLTPDALTARHSVDSDLLLFPQTDEVGHFQGDCVVRWKDIARIVEVDKENKGETK